MTSITLRSFPCVNKLRGRWAKKVISVLIAVVIVVALSLQARQQQQPLFHPHQPQLQRLVLHDEVNTSQSEAALNNLEAWKWTLQAGMLLVDSGVDKVTCDKLTSKAVTNKQQLQRLTSALTNASVSLPYGQQVTSVNECPQWTRRLGFHRWPVTRQELAFPLAFSFKVHTDPAMFVQLLSVVWRPHNWYCVHVDKKTPNDVFQHISNVTRCFQNVVMTSVRHDVVHASIISLQADLECAKLAVASSVPWRYHISSSGQEFPLKTNLEMVQILTRLNGSNDIENYQPADKFYNYALKPKWAVVNNTLKSYGEKRSGFPPQNVTVRKGCAYNCVTRSFLNWALTDKTNQAFLGWLADAWAPDEVFWATLSFRPEAPGGPRLTLAHDQNTVITMATIWPWDHEVLGFSCKGTVYRASCVFGSLDLPWLLTRHELFANKFNPQFDSTVLRCLEAELERRAVHGFIAWIAQWKLRKIQQDSANGNTDNSNGWGGGLAGQFLDGWPLLVTVNWTQYQSLPQFAKMTSTQL